MFTRCPECHTAFRVTAGQLQQAAGRVRCGHCGAAFDALTQLSEAHPSGVFPAVSPRSDDTTESADPGQPETSSMEVAEDEQEAEEIVLETGSHDLDELTQEDTPTRDDLAALSNDRQVASARSEDDDYVPEIEDTGIEWVVLDEETGSHWAQGARASGEAATQADRSEAPLAENLEDTLSREASALLGDDPSLASGSFWMESATPDAPDPLSDTAAHFWQAPAEAKDWDADADASAIDDNSDNLPMLLLAEPALEQEPEGEVTPEPETDFTLDEPPETAAPTDGADDVDLPDDVALPDDTALADDTSLPEHIDAVEDIHLTDETDEAGQAASDPAPEDDPPPAPEPAPVPEPAPSAAPGPAPARSTPHARPSRPPSIEALEDGEQAVASRRWLSVALALVLLAGVAAQSVHHFRDALAIDPRTGPAINWIYETLGRPLFPNWPLEDYELRAQDDALMAADRLLQIRATLSNKGARTLPSPLIRLTLLDRWGEAMGSRMFQPVEYLPAQAASRLSPGAQLEATLAVRAPPGELYGYRLDVCHPMDAGNVRCDAQSR